MLPSSSTMSQSDSGSTSILVVLFIHDKRYRKGIEKTHTGNTVSIISDLSLINFHIVASSSFCFNGGDKPSTTNCSPTISRNEMFTPSIAFSISFKI